MLELVRFHFWFWKTAYSFVNIGDFLIICEINIGITVSNGNTTVSDSSVHGDGFVCQRHLKLT